MLVGCGIVGDVRAISDSDAGGDIAARAPFDEFFRREYPACIRLAWLLSHGSIDHEDIAQDAFVGVQRRYEALENAAAYLRVCVVNGCRQHHRRFQREAARTRRVAAEWADADSSDVGLLSAIGCLPYDQRAVLVLRYWSDLPDNEIASLLRIRPATVRTRHHRALNTLRKDWNRDY